MVITVSSDADVVMTASGRLEHLCPHFEELDEGEVTITWRPLGQTLELHSLAEWLDEWRPCRVSHEEITDRICHALSVLPGIEVLSVVTTWTTAGMDVLCSTSPTPVVR